MPLVRRIKIRSFEAGLVFHEGEFVGIWGEGTYWRLDPLGRLEVQIVSLRAPWLVHEKLDMIVKSGLLKGRAVVLDLKDHERALVWIDGRFARVLPSGLYALWNTHCSVAVEVVDARQARFDHRDLKVILQSPLASQVLDIATIERDHVGVLFLDGGYVETLPPGQYAFWRQAATVRLVEVDLRDAVIDVVGQDIITSDKVSLRINALVTYRVVDARRAVSRAEDVRQALYRDVQLAVRAVIGARQLDELLAEKEAVVSEIHDALRRRASELGLEVTTVGIRDVILPGEMKELMNKVTEAKKAAEANLIVRREETAAMRSQSNTARLLAENPTLMRLRELEILEKIASSGKLNIVLGEKGLTDKVVNLL